MCMFVLAVCDNTKSCSLNELMKLSISSMGSSRSETAEMPSNIFGDSGRWSAFCWPASDVCQARDKQGYINS